MTGFLLIVWLELLPSKQVQQYRPELQMFQVIEFPAAQRKLPGHTDSESLRVGNLGIPH